MRHVIFDIGGVLIDFDFPRLARALAERTGGDEARLLPLFGGPHVLGVETTSVRVATRAPVQEPPSHHPYGDCRDLDEYARFQAMPPISRAEIEATDWDRMLADLFED